MTEAARERPRSRRPPGRRRRGGRALAWTAGVLVLAAVFGLGVAFGRALAETPTPGGTRTFVRTLTPTTVGPAERTVTVTVSIP